MLHARAHIFCGGGAHVKGGASSKLSNFQMGGVITGSHMLKNMGPGFHRPQKGTLVVEACKSSSLCNKLSAKKKGRPANMTWWRLPPLVRAQKL